MKELKRKLEELSDYAVIVKLNDAPSIFRELLSDRKKLREKVERKVGVERALLQVELSALERELVTMIEEVI